MFIFINQIRNFVDFYKHYNQSTLGAILGCFFIFYIALDKQPLSKGSVWFGRGNLRIVSPYPIMTVLPKTNPQHLMSSGL